MLVFVAKDVPAFGARVFRPAEAPAAGAGPEVQADAGDRTLDNGLLKLRVHSASGALDHLVDVATGRDLGGPWAGWGPEAKTSAGMLNRLQILWEQPHGMSAWNIGDITRIDNLITGAEVKVVESGPVRAAIEVKRQFLKSSLTQRIVLWQGLRRVDFETEVDWHERGSAHADAPMLRATFAPYLGQTDATFEIAFAGLQRPADGREVPALRWADVSEREGGQPSAPAIGLSLLNNCKYGHQAHGNTLGLTLVRASYEPDVNPDEGLHRFTYSLYPHAGDWQEAATVNQAAGLNQPLLAVVLPSVQPDRAAKMLRPGPARPDLRCAERHHFGGQAGRGSTGIRQRGDRAGLRGARQACGSQAPASLVYRSRRGDRSDRASRRRSTAGRWRRDAEARAARDQDGAS